MRRQRRHWTTGLFLAFLAAASLCSWPVHSLLTFPTQLKLPVGNEFHLNLSVPKQLLQRMQVQVTQDPAGTLASRSNVPVNSTYPVQAGLPEALAPGKIFLQLKLFGVIPLRKMVVDVIPQRRLIPGGHSIGVMLSSPGVMVVGYAPLTDSRNQRVYPAKEAGIELGDVILSINGIKVEKERDMSALIKRFGSQGQGLVLEISRKGAHKKVQVMPRYCGDTASYRVGLYIRDSAAGVGTLTFIDPETRKFGALGHIITDADTNQPIDVAKGQITRAKIQQIQKGEKGHPGEKEGLFIEDKSFTGKIIRNTKVGIFGQAGPEINNPIYADPLPVATLSQVKVGPAEILTVVQGEKIERFQIAIRRLLSPARADGKGMILEITDRRLLDKTGGIIQGMSGSPIIQDGRIVGAVTHVFINNPHMGYGVLIEKMLLEAGLLNDKTLQQAS